MSALRAFNTLKSFELLKSSGLAEEQARVFVDIFEQIASSSVEHLATKEDLSLSEARLEKQIAEVRSELKEDIAAVRQEVAEVRSELKQDIAAVKSELKEDNANLRQEMAGIKASVNGLSKMMYVFCGAIALNIVLTLIHIH